MSSQGQSKTQQLVTELKKTKKISVKIHDKGTKQTNITKLQKGDESSLQEQQSTFEETQNQQEKDLYIDIFDPEKFIDKSGYKILQVKGYGTYGVIYHIVHIQSKKRYFLKYFSNPLDFKEEKLMLSNLTSVFGKEKLESLTMTLENFIEEQNMLLYNGAECNLGEYCQQMNKQKILWHENVDQLNYLALRLFDIQQTLMEENIYQSDMKPDNVLLQNDPFSSNLKIKLNDFGIGSFQDYSKLNGVTFQFCQFEEQQLLKMQKLNPNSIFSTKEEREIYEFYQLGRTLQKIMVDSLNIIIEEENSYYSPILGDKGQKISFQNDKDSIKESLQKLSEYYPKQIMAFLESILVDQNKEKILERVEDLRNAPVAPIHDFESFVQKVTLSKLQDRSKNTKTEPDM